MDDVSWVDDGLQVGERVPFIREAGQQQDEAGLQQDERLAALTLCCLWQRPDILALMVWRSSLLFLELRRTMVLRLYEVYTAYLLCMENGSGGDNRRATCRSRVLDEQPQAMHRMPRISTRRLPLSLAFGSHFINGYICSSEIISALTEPSS